MAAVKSRGNRSTEQNIRVLLRSSGIKGWRSHLRNLPGRPDFALLKQKLAIFVDGCFWHGCKRCKRNLSPSSNRKYWALKIARNQARDKRAIRDLKKRGWRALKIWEHELRDPAACLLRIRKLLSE